MAGSQVASSFMAGPLVKASTSTATIEDGLSAALVSNNAEIILSMLDATITEDVDITKEANGPAFMEGFEELIPAAVILSNWFS